MVMPRLLAAFVLLGLAPQTPLAAAPVGPDAARCVAGNDALLVNVTGFKSLGGHLRVQLYGPNPADFLAKGKKLRRIDLPVTADVMDVCLALPEAGRYAVAVRHDANGNRSNDWNDGGGFSRNPRISLTNLEPRYNAVAITVGPGVHRVPVVMQYRRGLSIGPLKKSKA